MGNNQSNTRQKKYNIYKIASRITFSELTPKMISKISERNFSADLEREFRETIKFYVVNDFGWKDISCPNHSPFSEYRTGDYVEIEGLKLNKPWELPYRMKDNYINISDSNEMKIIGKVDSEGKVKDSEGNLLEETGNFLNEITEANQRYAAAAESARYQNQVLQFQTSYNLPPW